MWKAERRHHSDDETSIGQMSEQLAAYEDAFRWLRAHNATEIITSGKVERMSMLRDQLHFFDQFKQFTNVNKDGVLSGRSWYLVCRETST